MPGDRQVNRAARTFVEIDERVVGLEDVEASVRDERLERLAPHIGRVAAGGAQRERPAEVEPFVLRARAVEIHRRDPGTQPLFGGLPQIPPAALALGHDLRPAPLARGRIRHGHVARRRRLIAAEDPRPATRAIPRPAGGGGRGREPRYRAQVRNPQNMSARSGR